ncbi:MAG: hypothetical protein JWO22_1254 [Frankiales bacterium]|nr:hypothetical protein [Frankiales bacterium]
MIMFVNDPVVRLTGSADKAYFKVTQWDLRLLGIIHDPKEPHLLRLRKDADPSAILELPNGKRLTAQEVTELSSKSGDVTRGWQIWKDDPGGCPPEPFDGDLEGPAVLDV